MMKEERIRLTVRGIALEKESQTPIVILRNDEETAILPVLIGPSEASAIIIAMEGMKPPRPLTHDLLVQFLDLHGFSLLWVEIYGFLDGKHLARIRYRKGVRSWTLEVRPSDGIALAVRTQAPIYATREMIGLQQREGGSPLNIEAFSRDVLFLGSEKWNAAVM